MNDDGIKQYCKTANKTIKIMTTIFIIVGLLLIIAGLVVTFAIPSEDLMFGDSIMNEGISMVGPIQMMTFIPGGIFTLLGIILRLTIPRAMTYERVIQRLEKYGYRKTYTNTLDQIDANSNAESIEALKQRLNDLEAKLEEKNNNQ